MNTDQKGRETIVLLIPNMNFGGAQRAFHDQSMYLSQRYEVWESVFNLDHGYAFTSGNRVVNLEVPSGKNLMSKLFRFVHRCIRYRAVKKNQNIRVSISHLEGANYVNLLSGGKCRNIIVEHGSKLAWDANTTGLTGWLRMTILVRLIYRKADAIVTVSQGIKKELTGHFGIPDQKITVINNAFDLRRIAALGEASLSDKYAQIFSKRVLVTSGRFETEKNLFLLLDVFARVKSQIDCRLVMLGDGTQRNDLIEHAKNLKLNSWNDEATFRDADVYFTGYQENPFCFVSRSQLFLLPSTREGFPLTLCEAMICGVPVMATDCPTGPREILAPDTVEEYNLVAPEHATYGVLMPQLCDELTTIAWSKEIIERINDKVSAQQYSHLGKKRMENFSIDSIKEKWFALIESK